MIFLNRSLRLILVGLIGACLFAPGKIAFWAYGACWIVGGLLALVRGLHALVTGELVVIPDELGTDVELVGRAKAPTRFWLFVIAFFIVAASATAYGCWYLSHNTKAISKRASSGIKRGIAYGHSDDYDHEAVECPVQIADLHATVLAALGLNHEQLVLRPAGRDLRLADLKGTTFREDLT